MILLRGLFILLFLPGSSLAQTASQAWLGWRGNERHGVHAMAKPPVEWSAERNIEWVTDLPGEGHSSPVVSDGRVFVTAAYPATHRDWIKQILTALSFGLIGLTVVVGLLFVGSARAASLERREARFATRSAPAAFIVALFGFVSLAVFGPAVLDFDRCIIRGWLGTNLTAALGLSLAVTTVRKPTPRLAMALVLVALGIATVVALPSKDHAFRNGYGSASAVVVLTIAAVPIVIGALQSRACGRGPIWMPSHYGDRDENTGRGTWAFRARWIPLLVVGWLVAYWIGAEPDPNPQQASPRNSNNSLAMLSMALAVPIGTWFVYALASVEWFPSGDRENEPPLGARRWRLAFAIVGAIAAIAAFVGLIVGAIHHCDYLHYQLGASNGKLILPTWPYAWLSVGLVTLGLWGAVYSRRCSIRQIFGWSGISLASSMLVTSSTLLIDRYVVPTRSVLTRAILCFDMESGEHLWSVEGLEGAEGRLHRHNSAATPTPIISRDRVYAYFGSGGLMCASVDGNRCWTNSEIQFESVYGVGVSPILHGNRILVVNGLPNASHALACDIETGRLLWRTELKSDVNQISGHSRTPLVCHIGDKDVLIVWGFNEINSIDIATGEMLNCVQLKSSGDLVASVVRQSNNLFFVDHARITVIPIAQLLQPQCKEVWSKRIRGSNCSSALVYQGMLFMVTDGGISSCVDAETGELHWKCRLPGEYYASPVAANRHVYFMNRDGVTTVVAAEKKLRVVAANELNEPLFASPALSGDSLVLRTTSRLYKLTNTHTSTEALAEDEKASSNKEASHSRISN